MAEQFNTKFLQCTVDPSGSPESINFTPEIVYDKIMTIHNSKSPGPDGWPILIIKSASKFIATLLSVILTNHSIVDQSYIHLLQIYGVYSQRLPNQGRIQRGSKGPSFERA